MSKKWIVGALVIAMIGVLVYGAILRTSATSEKGLAVGRGIEQATGQGRGRSEMSGVVEPVGEASVEEWVTIKGVVSEMDATHLLVTAEDGKIIEVANRAWLYAQPTLKVAPGDAVTLVGFYEGEDFEVGKITVEQTGQVVAVRDDYGRPLWSGRGGIDPKLNINS